VTTAELLVPLVLGVVANEAVDVCPWLARKLVRWSARRITDAAISERYEEEWLAGLGDRPGKLLKLISAISIIFGASWRMRDIFRARESDGAVRRRRWPRPHQRLTLPFGLRVLPGYGMPILAVTGWLSHQSVVLVLVPAAVGVLCIAFQVPTTCGVAVRGRSGACRNYGSGLLLGCHIRQHRTAKLRWIRRMWRR
jgi:hypothetical protein